MRFAHPNCNISREADLSALEDIVRRCLCFIILVLGMDQAFAEPNVLDPSQYLIEKEFERHDRRVQEGLKYHVIQQRGVKYLKVAEGSSAILVPMVNEKVTVNQLELSQCVPSYTAPEALVERATAAKILQNLNSRLTLYGELIVKTVRKKCGPGGYEHAAEKRRTPLNPDPALDFGLEWDGSKGRQKETYRIYNRNLGPNLNFEKEF